MIIGDHPSIFPKDSQVFVRYGDARKFGEAHAFNNSIALYEATTDSIWRITRFCLGRHKFVSRIRRPSLRIPQVPLVAQFGKNAMQGELRKVFALADVLRPEVCA